MISQLFVPGSQFPARSRSAIVAAWLLAGALSSPAQPPAEVTPWTGEAGVTETTAGIMLRQQLYVDAGVAEGGDESKRRPHGRKDPQNLFQNPGSPDVAVYPGQGPQLAAGQTAGLSFAGATLGDTASYPPDSMGAAGPAQYIVAVNGRIRSFTKSTGVADGVLDANTDVFFNSVMTPPTSSNFTTDPRIRYDRLSGRWFITMVDVPGGFGSLPNRVMIAVSGGAVVTPATPWTFFQFQQDQVAPTSKTDTGKFADYPTLAIDANALYIGVNIFGTRGLGSFANTTAFVVRKSSILGAGPLVATAFRDLVSKNGSGPYTPQGVDNYDPAATEGYIIGVDSAYYGRLQLLRVSDPGGTPAISSGIVITVPATGGTLNVPHLGNAGGTGGYLDGLDYRLMAAHVRNGRLWTCANIAVDNTGSPSGTDTRMGVRWYELSGIATGQTPAVVQAGTLFQPSAANDSGQRHYWMGTIMVSGQGHAVLGFSAAGANEHINAGYAGRLAGDPLGTLRTPVLYTASGSAYNPPGDPGGAYGRRWGDYSYTCLDPSDDMTLWTIQEWCNATDSYAVQVLKILAPPPATPVTAIPASLAAGQSNVAVSIIGTNTDGAGFFDPGAGFSNRISAAVSGSGVTVNSIIYQNPTNVTLNVSVSASAPSGARLVTVINPDGQSVSSASGLLTITGSAATNHPPSIAPIANRTILEQTLLAFAVTATDPDTNPITFSLDPGAPTGATIATNGLFSWTPTEMQGPSTNSITVRATDNGVPPLSATQAFTVVVLESNLPPVLAPIANRVVHAGMTVSFTNSATDPDWPPNTLTFGLLPGVPAGAAVNPSTGVFSWLTADANAGSTNSITVTVQDNGTPPLSDARTFSVAVLARPYIESTGFVTNSVRVTWRSIAGISYRLQYRTNLAAGAWTDAPAAVTAIGPLATAFDITPPDAARFYRVRVQ